MNSAGFMIYIDFFGGSHGNFLQFLIAKHILKLPQYKNFFPFKKSGVSHIKPTVHPNVIANHFTYGSDKVIPIKESPENFLIQIKVTPNVLQDVFAFNAVQRAGEAPIDFDLLVNDYKAALVHDKWASFLKDITKEYGGRPTKRDLRNKFYSLIFEKDFVEIHQKFKKYNLKTIAVPFESFYSYDLLVKQLYDIAIFINNPLEIDQVDIAWNKFMELNEGYKIKLKIDSLFNNIINDIATPISLNIFEEASLNSRITKFFNIQDGISTFDNVYPYNTQDISIDIKKIMNKRNPEFSTNISIAKQLEKISLEF